MTNAQKAAALADLLEDAESRLPGILCDEQADREAAAITALWEVYHSLLGDH